MTTETTKGFLSTCPKKYVKNHYDRHIDVLELFGKHFTCHRNAVSPLPKDVYQLDEKHQVWFPKFYKNTDWDNQIDAEGKYITQKSLDKPIDTTKEIPKSIVFAHEECEATSTLQYVFKGVFERIVDENLKDEIRYKRISEEINLDDFQQSQ